MFFPCFNYTVYAGKADLAGGMREQKARQERAPQPHQAAAARGVPPYLRAAEKTVRGGADPQTL